MVARIVVEEEFCATPHNRAHEKVRHGYVGRQVTDFGCGTSQILGAEVAGGGGADLQVTNLESRCRF